MSQKGEKYARHGGGAWITGAGRGGHHRTRADHAGVRISAVEDNLAVYRAAIVRRELKTGSGAG